MRCKGPRPIPKGIKIIDILVIRITQQGELGESCPCYHCIQTMSRSLIGYRVRYVYYSRNDGTITKKNLEELKEVALDHVSSGNRKSERGKITIKPKIRSHQNKSDRFLRRRKFRPRIADTS